MGQPGWSGAGIKADIAPHVRREIPCQFAQPAAVDPAARKTGERGHEGLLSGDKAEGGAELCGKVFPRSVDEARACFAHDERGNGVDLKSAGQLPIGFDDPGRVWIVERIAKDSRLEPEIPCHCQNGFGVGNIAGFAQMSSLQAVEHVPMCGLPANAFGGLAAEGGDHTVGIVEGRCPHGVDIDKLRPVADLAAGVPVAKDGLAGVFGCAPACGHLGAAGLQDEGPVPDIEIELLRKPAHPRRDVEAPAADDVVKEIYCKGRHHAASSCQSAPARRTAIRATCAPWKRAPARSVPDGARDPSAPAMVPAP